MDWKIWIPIAISLAGLIFGALTYWKSWPFGFSCGMAQRLPGVTGLSHRPVEGTDDEQSAPFGAQTNIWQGG
jgi:hypothetical protein